MSYEQCSPSQTSDWRPTPAGYRTCFQEIGMDKTIGGRMLRIGQAVEDAQYGRRGALNNLPTLADALGADPNTTKELAEAIRELTETLKKMCDKPLQ